MPPSTAPALPQRAVLAFSGALKGLARRSRAIGSGLQRGRRRRSARIGCGRDVAISGRLLRIRMSPRLACLLAAFAATSIAGAWGAGSVAAEPPACAGLEEGPTRSVARIIDGETVALDDGSELRLIGALAPRAA